MAGRLTKKTRTLKLLKGEDCQHCMRQDYRSNSWGGVELYCHMRKDFFPKENTCDEWWSDSSYNRQILRDRIIEATQIPKEYLFREESIK